MAIVIQVDFQGRDVNVSRVASAIERAIRGVEAAANGADNAGKDFGVAYLRASANVGRDIEQIGRAISGVGQGVANFGLALTGFITVPFVTGLQQSAQAAIEFESAFAGVIKTVDGLVVAGTINELNEQGIQLRQGLIDLSREIPTTAVELSRIGELAGQLGVGAGDIQLFTKVIAEFVESTDVGLDDAAKSLAQIANVFGREVDGRFAGSISRFADATSNAIVALGNNFATTESGILQFFQTFAGNAAGANISVSDTLAIATAFRSVRAQSAASSTALQRLFQSLQTSASTSTSALQPFLDVVNAIGTEAEGSFSVAAESFRELALNDPGEALFLFLRGLREFGPTIPNVLQGLGLGDRRLIRELNKAAGGVDQLRAALDLSAESFGEFGDNGARAIEAARRFATVESQFQLLKNDIQALAIAVGDKLLPSISEFIDVLRDGVDGAIEFFQQMDEETFKTVLAFGALLAAIGPAIFVLGKLIVGIGSLVQAVGLIQAGVNALRADMIALALAEEGAAVGANQVGLSMFNMGAKVRTAATFVKSNIVAFGALSLAIVGVLTLIAAMDSRASQLGDTLNDNLDSAIGASDAFLALEETLGGNAEAVFQQQKAIVGAVNSYEQYIDVMTAAGSGTESLTEDQYNAVKAFDTLATATDKARIVLDEYSDSLDGLGTFDKISLGVFGGGEINDAQQKSIDAIIDSIGIFESGTSDAAESVEQLKSALIELNQINVDAGVGNLFGITENNRTVARQDAEELRQIVIALQERGATNQEIFDTVAQIVGDERLAIFALREALDQEIDAGFWQELGAGLTGSDKLIEGVYTALDELGRSSKDVATDVDELVSSVSEVQGLIGLLDIGEVALFTTLQKQAGASTESIAAVISSLRELDLERLNPENLGLTDGEAVSFGFDIETGQFSDLEGAINAAIFAIQNVDAATLGLAEGQEISVQALQAWIAQWPMLTDEIGRAVTIASLLSEAYTVLSTAIGEVFAGSLEDAIGATVDFVRAQEALDDALASGDTESIVEAYAAMQDAQIALIDSSNELILELSRIELIEGPEGYEAQVRDIDEAYIELSRSLGVYTDAEADAAIQQFRTREALEEVASAAAFLGLTTEEAAAAQILIREGLADTTEEAIGLATANDDLVDKTLAYNRSLHQQSNAFEVAIKSAEEYANKIVDITEAQNDALAASIDSARSLVEGFFANEEPTIDLTDGLFSFDFANAENELADLKALLQQTALDILTAGEELSGTQQVDLELEFGLITPEQAKFEKDLINVQNALRFAFGTILIDNVPVSLQTILGDVDQTQLIEDVTNATAEAGRDLSSLLALVALVAVEYDLNEEQSQDLTALALENAAQGQADVDAVSDGIVQVIPVTTNYELVPGETLPDTEGAQLSSGAPESVTIPVTVEGVEETVAELATIATTADTVVGEEARQIIFESNIEDVEADTTAFDELATVITNTDYRVEFDKTSVDEALEVVRELETEVTDLSATITYQVIVEDLPNPSNVTVPPGGAGSGNAPSPEDGYWQGGVVGGPPGADRSPAMLTRGEYVVPTSAMREPGVKQLLDGLRGGLTVERAARRVGVDRIGPPQSITPIIDGGNVTHIDNSETHIDNSRKLDIEISERGSRGRTAAHTRQTWGRY